MTDERTIETEWAVQCHTRDGDLHTGRAFTTEREAIESGERLGRINGAEWWLITRRWFVTVETTPWERDRSHETENDRPEEDDHE